MALVLRLEKRKIPDQVKKIFKQAEEGESIMLIQLWYLRRKQVMSKVIWKN